MNPATTPFSTIVRSFRWIGHVLTSIPLPNLSGTRRFNGVRQSLIDLRTLERMHDPVRAARRDAQRDDKLPEDNRGHYEHTTLMGFQSEAAKLRSQTHHAMSQVQVQIQTLAQIPSLNQSETLQRVSIKRDVLCSDAKTGLMETRVSVLRNQRSLRAYRSEHGIFRDCIPQNLVLAVLGVVASVSIESAFGLHFLSSTGIASPLDVLVFVGATSLVNVALGVLSGFFGIRNLSHISPSRKMTGAAIFAIGLASAGSLHFLLSCYRYMIDRALVESGGVDDGSHADLLLEKFKQVQTGLGTGLIEHPMVILGDTSAVVVFAVGMLFFGISVWEGSTLFSDPYPGLSTYHNAYRRSARKHDAVQKKLGRKLDRVLSDTNRSLDLMAKEGKKRLHAIKGHLDQALNVARLYAEEAARLDNSLIRLVADYRDSYREIRGNDGPEYWRDDIPHVDLEASFTFDALVEIYETQERDYATLVNVIEATKSDLLKEQAGLIGRMETYLSLIDREALTEDGMAPAGIEA